MEKHKNVIIEASKLNKNFKTGDIEQQVISDMNITIYEGDFTVIMGSSGAGKSTLMYVLSGMDRATSGSIVYKGEDIVSYSDDKLAVFRRKNCGFVFQQMYLLEKMSLIDNVVTAGSLVEKNKSLVKEHTKELLKKVNIEETLWHKFPSQISGGEAQRVGIVRSLINTPAVVFADEPTGALNSSNSDVVLDVFSKINNEGQSVIMVTHDKKSALRANRIIYLKDGKIFGELKLENYNINDHHREELLNNFLAEMEW
ncbi:ABC transporter ATP-binding protein [Breznakia pachnodae]|uniref:ABC transport system ATP-binding protein n=1 Tax=Breznakia pachnodae TaxID=265178 RepID=A0ABU0E576_9FIRM|nr:ABC transporter ATP-binding protein [Breznakia pachnodae]MDQ0362053.1 putative ABC transport system ATP-binding protein [Breznakia pachnodae]